MTEPVFELAFSPDRRGLWHLLPVFGCPRMGVPECQISCMRYKPASAQRETNRARQDLCKSYR